MLDEAEDEVVRLCEYDNVRVGRFYVLDSFLLCMLIGTYFKQRACATVMFAPKVYYEILGYMFGTELLFVDQLLTSLLFLFLVQQQQNNSNGALHSKKVTVTF